MDQSNHQQDADLIQSQLRNLLSYETFVKAPLLSRFLDFVVNMELAGRQREIKEYSIGIALGRHPDFNPQTDAAVRAHASRLRNLLYQYYAGPGKNDPVFITIPKGGYIPKFEISQEKTGAPGHVPQSINEQAEIEKKNSDKSSITRPVLAVLPFHELRGQPENPIFLQQLCEQLSAGLSRFDNVSSISYYVSAALSSQFGDLQKIKQQCAVDYVLTGSVRIVNETIKLNMELVFVDTGRIVWTGSYLRNQNDVRTYDIFDDIVNDVVNSIADDRGMISSLNKVKLYDENSTQASFTSAICRYFDYVYNYDNSRLESTLSAVEAACRDAENNVMLISILSKLYLNQYLFSLKKNLTLLEKGMDAARKAVSLDPFCQHAQKSLAWGYMLAGRKEKSLEVIDRCISINPCSSSCCATMGLALICLGEYDRGFAMIEKSTQLNPDTTVWAKLGFSLYYYVRHNYSESLKWLEMLPPFKIPFTDLLGAALKGAAGKDSIKNNEAVLVLKGNYEDIMNRFVFDPAMKTAIGNGWQMAGF